MIIFFSGCYSMKVIFYSNVTDKKIFQTSSFYKIDISILRDLGYEVLLSNKIKDLLFCDYDFSFLYFYKYSVFAAFFAKLRGKKVFFTGGIDDLNKETTSLFKYIRQCLLYILCYILCDKIAVVSSTDLHNMNYVLKKKSCAKKLTFIPHCLDKNLKKVDIIYEKEKIFLSICWMENSSNLYRKGIDKSITLFKELSQYQEFSDYIFYIIGRGSIESKELHQLISETGLENKIIALGEVSDADKYDYLKRSKYYFQLSEYEGFGLAALEALYFQNIVIHSNSGGLRDFVLDGGVVVSDADGSVVQNIIKSSELNISDISNRIQNNYLFDNRKQRFKSLFDSFFME